MSNNLILCPDLWCDPALWRAQIDGLQDCATLHVADFTTDDSITAMAERVLGTAQDTFALAGLSMGGYVAQEIVRPAPTMFANVSGATPKGLPEMWVAIFELDCASAYRYPDGSARWAIKL